MPVVLAPMTLGSFEEFFAEEHVRLLRAMYLACGDWAEAEDLAQNAMMRAYERWPLLGELDNPVAYVYKIGFNLNRSRLRRLVRWRHHALEESPLPVDEADTELRLDIMLALAKIPRPQREALVLVEWLGLTSLEASAILGISAASVRSRTHRARASLKDLLGGLDE